MRARSSERLGAATGLVAAVAVGAPVLVDLAAGDGDLAGRGWLWWAAYALFIGALALDGMLAGPRSDPLTARALLAVEIVAACVVYLADPDYGWAAVLLVVTAASGAYVLSPRQSTVQIAAQCAVIGLGPILGADAASDDVVLAVVVYGAFQWFAVLLVRSEQREAARRSELAAANVELRAMSALLVHSSQAAERLRIARELHDVVGHQLTALCLQLEVATHHTGDDARCDVLRARDLAKELLGDVRDAVGDLRAPEGRLADSLLELVDGLPGPTVDLEIVEEAPVDAEQAVTIIRCVQELVTNTIRHADADRLWITVRSGTEDATIIARDDGRGATVVREGNGFTGMRERLAALHGDLAVESDPGHGFAVTARFPLRGEPA